MSIMHRIDPELRPIVEAMPIFTLEDIPADRRSYHAMMADMPMPTTPGVVSRDMVVPARGDHPPVRVRAFLPEGAATGLLPAICWIPGGGYVMDSPFLDDATCQHLVAEHECIVVAVDWRRAPEHPFPAATEDCYGVLAWMAADGGALGIDPDRLVIGGQSSGGGSAAGVALLVRDRKEFAVLHQLLVYPMLDDRNDTPSAQQVSDDKVWNNRRNTRAWQAYLGTGAGDDTVSPYAAPARMADLTGSIPASILTGELDLFRDEDIAYASRLMAVGVSTELHVYPGAPHGFDQIAPDATVSRRFNADRDAILRRVFSQHLARPRSQMVNDANPTQVHP